MPRFLGKNINNASNFLDTQLAEQVSSSGRQSWYTFDWYSKTFNPKLGRSIKDLNAYLINDVKDVRSVRCLDLTDKEMSNSPLKRFHQVVICGNHQIPKSGEGNNLIGGYTNSQDYVITAQLPNSFRYNIGSNWSEPFKSVIDFSKYVNNGVTSMATNGQNSLMFGLATMSVWESPTPLQIQLTLQCLDDIASGTNQNTLEAIDILSRFALPYQVNKWGMYSGMPGPQVPPITINYNKYDENGNLVSKNTEKAELTVGNSKNSTRLSVLIGGMLFMDYCILKSIDVNYPNTKAQYLHDYYTSTFTQDTDTIDAGIRLLPVRCDITLTLQTVMGLTQTNFRNMLALRDNNNPANMIPNDLNIGGIQEALNDNVLGIKVGAGISSTINGAKSLVRGISQTMASL